MVRFNSFLFAKTSFFAARATIYIGRKNVPKSHILLKPPAKVQTAHSNIEL